MKDSICQRRCGAPHTAQNFRYNTRTPRVIDGFCWILLCGSRGENNLCRAWAWTLAIGRWKTVRKLRAWDNNKCVSRPPRRHLHNSDSGTPLKMRDLFVSNNCGLHKAVDWCRAWTTSGSNRNPKNGKYRFPCFRTSHEPSAPWPW